VTYVKKKNILLQPLRFPPDEIASERHQSKFGMRCDPHTGFIIEANDAGALGCIGWTIERHLDSLPSNMKPTFRLILDDTRIRKDNLERS
jgi:hypothetical protein